MTWKMCGYCEHGYRLFIVDGGAVVKRFPVPTTEVY